MDLFENAYQFQSSFVSDPLFKFQPQRMIIFHDISLRNTTLIQVRFLNNYCIILNFAFKHHLESDISPKSF